MSIKKWVSVVATYSISIDNLPWIYYFSDPWVPLTIRKLNFSSNESIVGVVIHILMNPVYVINFGGIFYSLVLLLPFSSGWFISMVWKVIIHHKALKVIFSRYVICITKVTIQFVFVVLILVFNVSVICLINFHMLNWYVGQKSAFICQYPIT